jgi:hypothetical protein
MVRRTRDAWWVEVVHAVLDGAVIAFCVWTVLYEITMATRGPASTAVSIWLPLAVLSVAACVWRVVRAQRADAGLAAEPADRLGTGRPGPERLRTLLAGAAVTLGVAAGAVELWQPGEQFLTIWALLLPAALALLLRVAISPPRPTVGPSPRTTTHLLAALVVIALAFFMMFVLHGDPDDVYYVNRSVWTAQHNTFALRDTMFGPGTLPATYGGGVPLASIEGLIGALARVTHVSAAAFSYLIAEPVGCLLAGWAAWRLVSEWAPRRALLVLVASFGFSLMSATGTVGDFSYARMWTGKVMALCIVVPLAWTYFTRVASGERRPDTAWNLTMLFACGLAFAGLTPTAVLVAPMMSAAVVLAALVTRRRVLLQLLAGVAFALAPVVAGLAVILLPGKVGGQDPQAPFPFQAFDRVMGHDPWIVALAVLGLVAGPLVLAGRQARAMAAAATFVVLLVLLPGFPDLLNSLTGSGPIYYRLILVAPIATLVAMLLAVPIPRSVPEPAARVAVGALVVGFACVLVLGGTSAWSSHVGGRLTTTPHLKIRPLVLHDVTRVLALHPGSPLLLPLKDMEAVPILTTRKFAVVPRQLYLQGLPDKGGHYQDRWTLRDFADTSNPRVLPSQARLDLALEDLHVSTVCTFPSAVRRVRRVERAGYHDPRRAGRLVCFAAPGRSFS